MTYWTLLWFAWKKKKYNELTGLLGLLNLTMLDNYLNSDEKRKILSTEFNVKITPGLEKGVTDICNLSAGIEKQGVQKGIEQGIDEYTGPKGSSAKIR